MKTNFTSKEYKLRTYKYTKILIFGSTVLAICFLYFSVVENSIVSFNFIFRKEYTFSANIIFFFFSQKLSLRVANMKLEIPIKKKK